MEIEKHKFVAKKNIVRSFLLLVIFTPLLFGVILKLFYYLPKGGDRISDGVVGWLQDLVSRLYYGFEPIQYIWPLSPMPSFEDIFVVGNVLSLGVFVGFLWGIASFLVGVGAINKLSQAKNNARKRALEDEYRDKD